MLTHVEQYENKESEEIHNTQLKDGKTLKILVKWAYMKILKAINQASLCSHEILN